MRESLVPGLEGTFRYRVPATKTVPRIYPEAPDFQMMPSVLATGYFVALAEWACIELIKPHLDWPREQTVGTHVNVSHEAATPAGFILTARAVLVGVDGRKLRFEVEADDGVDRIARGTHERAIIVREKFDARLAAKAEKKPSG